MSQSFPETESLIENLLQACVDYERCERFDAKHRRLDLEEAKQAIRNAIGASLAQGQQVTDEMINAHLLATGEWVNPFEAEYEGGVQISGEMSQADADAINAMSRNDLRKGYAAALSDTSTDRQCAPAPDQAWRDSAWLGLSASEKACYHWPDDTDLHRQCRAAYIAGATDYAMSPPSDSSPEGKS